LTIGLILWRGLGSPRGPCERFGLVVEPQRDGRSLTPGVSQLTTHEVDFRQGGDRRPLVGRSLGHVVGARPSSDRDALRERKGELGFLALAIFSRHGTKCRTVALAHRGSALPHSRFSARGPGWPARPRRARKCWEWLVEPATAAVHRGHCQLRGAKTVSASSIRVAARRQADLFANFPTPEDGATF